MDPSFGVRGVLVRGPRGGTGDVRWEGGVGCQLLVERWMLARCFDAVVGEDDGFGHGVGFVGGLGWRVVVVGCCCCCFITGYYYFTGGH